MHSDGECVVGPVWIFKTCSSEINGGAGPDSNPMGLENAFKRGMGCWSHLGFENMHTDIMGNDWALYGYFSATGLETGAHLSNSELMR